MQFIRDKPKCKIYKIKKDDKVYFIPEIFEKA